MRMMFVEAAVGTLALVVLGSVAIADKKPEQIKVEASRIQKEKAAPTISGIPVWNISLSYEVSLDDLDLTTSAGVAAAEKRINTAALDACKEIGRQYPASSPADEACAKAATGPALAKLHEAVAATLKPPTK